MRILVLTLLLFTAGCGTRFDDWYMLYGEAQDCPICRSKIDIARSFHFDPKRITKETIDYIESDCSMCGRVNKARKEAPNDE